MNPANRSKLNRITFGATNELHEKIKIAAEKSGKSVSAWCAEIVAKAVRAKRPVIRMGRRRSDEKDSR